MHQTKTCTLCEQIKPIEEFSLRTVDGRKYPRTRCKPCWNKNHTNVPGHQAKRARIQQRRNQKISEARANGDLLVISRSILQDSRGSDRKFGRENNLTQEFILGLISKPCSYCDDTDCRMTVDRVDNDLGHLTTNVVPACIRCNLTRGNMPYEAWLVVAPGMKTAKENGLFGKWAPRSKKKN